MKFDSIINSLLKEEDLSREDRIKALKTLKDTKENIPSAYRSVVDDLINQHTFEELKSMLAMEKRMETHSPSNSRSAAMYIRALEYAVAELE